MAPTTTTTQPTQAPAVPLHSNPQVAKALAFAASAQARGVAYPSAAALCRAAGVHGKANQRNVRQALRNAYGAQANRQPWGTRPVGRGTGKLANALAKAPTVAQRKQHAAQVAQAKAAKAQAKAS